MRQSSAAVLSVESCDESEDVGGEDLHGRDLQGRDLQDQGSRNQAEPREVPPGARPWGFIRRSQVQKGEEPAPTESDVSLWFDRESYRFLVVADKVVKDDLAPIEFVQFVRELRHSTTQILFKFETRIDGTVGRPICVWL